MYPLQTASHVPSGMAKRLDLGICGSPRSYAPDHLDDFAGGWVRPTISGERS